MTQLREARANGGGGTLGFRAVLFAPTQAGLSNGESGACLTITVLLAECASYQKDPIDRCRTLRQQFTTIQPRSASFSATVFRFSGRYSSRRAESW